MRGTQPLGGVIALCALAAPHSVGAQSLDAGSPHDEIPAAAAQPPESAQLPATERALAVKTVIDNDGACRHAPIGGASVLDPLGCPFDTTKFAVAMTSHHELPFGTVEISTAFGRASEDSLSLRRQFVTGRSGTSEQSSLVLVGANAKLLEGRVSLSSEFGWNNRWRTQAANPLLWSRTFDRRRSYAQEHKIDLKLIDRRRLSLSVDASLKSAGGYFLPFTIDRPTTLFAMPGREIDVGSRARVGDLAVRARYSTQDGDFFDRDAFAVSLAHSGITLRAQASRTRSKPYSIEVLERTSINAQSTDSRTWRLGLDIIPMALFPTVAGEDEGWASLIPQTLSVQIGRRSRLSERDGVLLRSSGPTFASNAMWSTPLGDTLVTYDRQVRQDSATGPSALRLSDSTLLIDQSLALGEWALSGNVMFSKNAAFRGGSQSATNNVTYYGVGASRRLDNGSRVRFEFGQDAASFDLDQGDFELRDRSTQLKTLVDLSGLLRKRFGRDDLHFRVESRIDFDRSSYEVRFLDEVIDRELERLRATGALATFGMAF